MFFTNANLQSHSLTTRSPARQSLTQWLGLPLTSTLNTIANSLRQRGWEFTVADDRLINLKCPNNFIIEDPHTLPSNVFTGWIEYEDQGVHYRALFENDEITSGWVEIELYPPSTLDRQTLMLTIRTVENYLLQLCARQNQFPA